MDREDKLREEYEDAYFALLMNEVAKAKGAELLKENERLKEDPAFDVPESVTRRSMETIRREFARQDRKKAAGTVRKVFTRVACVAMLAALMLVTAYATIPDFRTIALNLMMESTDIKTRITLTDEDVQQKSEETVLLGYRIPEMPEGFEVEDQWEGDQRAWIEYLNSNRASTIKIQVSHDVKHTITADTEDADEAPVKIQGFNGLLSIKDETVHIIWNDPNTKAFISVLGEGLAQSVVEEIAENILSVTD